MAKDIETNKELFQLWLDELEWSRGQGEGGTSGCQITVSLGPRFVFYAGDMVSLRNSLRRWWMLVRV